MPDNLRERCREFVEKQSAGEWGEAVEAEDTDALLRFVESEVQREREECAKVAEERSQTLPIDSDTTRGYANGRQAAAHAIRSRGAK